MGLPFTPDQFFDVFNDYNRWLWPVLLLGGLHGMPFPECLSCPTTILTIGLLMAARPMPVVTAIIPIIWSLIGGSAAILFGVSADLMLLVAGAGLFVHIIVTLRRSERDSAVSTQILEKPRSS
jgi:uncharacterized protein DUF6064